MGDSVHHEENDNEKEQGCQNEEQQSHSPEQHEIMEPVSVLEEQLYSPNMYVYGGQEHVHHIMKPKKMMKSLM